MFNNLGCIYDFITFLNILSSPTFFFRRTLTVWGSMNCPNICMYIPLLSTSNKERWNRVWVSRIAKIIMKYDDASSLISTKTTVWLWEKVRKRLSQRCLISFTYDKSRLLVFRQTVHRVWLLPIIVFLISFKLKQVFKHFESPQILFISVVTHTETQTCPCVVTTITCKKVCDMACLRYFLYDCYI